MVRLISCLEYLKIYILGKDQKEGIAISGNSIFGETVYFIGCKKGEKPKEVIRIRKQGDIQVTAIPLYEGELEEWIRLGNNESEEEDIPHTRENFSYGSLDVLYSDEMIVNLDEILKVEEDVTEYTHKAVMPSS